MSDSGARDTSGQDTSGQDTSSGRDSDFNGLCEVRINFPDPDGHFALCPYPGTHWQETEKGLLWVCDAHTFNEKEINPTHD